ncbi:hypothetical protein [Methylophaga sp. OBS1]|uniref:hypothetical protein n=1 Tax=Methylophaga sp. OBS1 TaxID=2991933 RepID=UPI002253DE32|nr:hypothetical protein [Methylophaga sp. OBS1]MCX4192574.1 hypothetical protein [Methylophaga sp. OBS1]
MINESLKNIIENVQPGCFHSFVQETPYNYLLLINNITRKDDEFYRDLFMRRIYPELNNAELTEMMGDCRIIISKTHKDVMQALVRSIVENDIKYMRNLYEHDVEVKLNESRFRGTSISIRVLIRQYANKAICDAVYQRLSELKPTISKIIGTENIRVDAFGQKPSYYMEARIEAPADDDGDDDNPNWPSTTGNPSGGGRGNNPPSM